MPCSLPIPSEPVDFRRIHEILCAPSVSSVINPSGNPRSGDGLTVHPRDCGGSPRADRRLRNEELVRGDTSAPPWRLVAPFPTAAATLHVKAAPEGGGFSRTSGVGRTRHACVWPLVFDRVPGCRSDSGRTGKLRKARKGPCGAGASWLSSRVAARQGGTVRCTRQAVASEQLAGAAKPHGSAGAETCHLGLRLYVKRVALGGASQSSLRAVADRV